MDIITSIVSVITTILDTLLGNDGVAGALSSVISASSAVDAG